MKNWMTKYGKAMKALNTGCTTREKVVKYLQVFGCQNYSQKGLRDNRSFADFVLVKNYSLSETVKPDVLRPSLALIAKNELKVPHNERRPTG